MEVKKIISFITKYKLYSPYQLYRFLYYNFFCINIQGGGKSYLYISRYAIFDLKKTSTISLSQPVDFGWCNMHRSKLETALCMGENSILHFTCRTNKKLLIGYGSYIQVGSNATLKIGNSFINREVKIICNKNISIGDGCIIAMGTVIRDNDGGNHEILSQDYVNSKPVKISNHVWIGENVMILKGVTIGEGAIVAAGALVTKDIPPHCLVMGAPAKVVRENIEWKA